MVRTIGDYDIKIEQEPYSRHSVVDSSCNYDSIYLDDLDEPYSILIGIKAYKDDSIVKSALIGANGGGTAICDT